MSSCAASCSIYFHAASSAFATSASLPTDNGPGCCHSASAYFGVQKPSPLQQHRLHRTVLTHPGIVLCAAQLCMSSNGSPQLNSCSVLRHSTSSTHENTAPTSIPPRVRTCTQILRLTWLTPLCGPSFSLLPDAHNNAHLERLPPPSIYAIHKAKRRDHPPRLSSIESP